jgi:phage protein U
METMMILGEYAFGLNTAAFQELNRDTQWRWGSQDVFDALPALQFTGWGEDTITLPGVIFPEYWGGTGQLDELRALGDTGEPQILIDGRGNVLGEWVITSVSERQSIFGPAGAARRQEFTVSLKRYA